MLGRASCGECGKGAGMIPCACKQALAVDCETAAAREGFSKPLTPEGVRETLIYGLTPVADSLRDLEDALGASSYDVDLVWTRWTGGERGAGEEFEIQRHMIQPNPVIVSGMDVLDLQATEIGTEEAGVITLGKISLSYCEALLLGRSVVVPLGGRLPPDVSFYYEIRSVLGGIPRRFQLFSAPSLKPTSFEWRVRLVRASHSDGHAG